LTLDAYIDTILDKRICVIGAGVSNTPWIEKLLQRGCHVTVRDRREANAMEGEAERLSSLGAQLRLGADYLDDLDEQIIFRTPGLLPFDEHLVEARRRGCLVTSEMELFCRLCPCPIIAVTGSDGKTTTTTIISELMKAAGYRVHLGGNIGTPLLCELPDFCADDWAILELSSFQLHSMDCRPRVAVITNLSPNHLDKHLDFQDYADAKRSIFLGQQPGDRLILNREDANSDAYAASAPAEVCWFSDRREIDHGAILRDGKIFRVGGDRDEYIMDAEEILLPGSHNVQNYLAAFAAVEGLVGAAVCRDVAMRFAGVEHRLERVRVLHGVTYINDSIASSPTRTIAGLHALKTKPVIILGGYDKHIPFDELGDELCRSAKCVVLTGATAPLIRSAVESSPFFEVSGLPIIEEGDFRRAVLAASAAAGEGDIVILSPACASFDHFRNFAERGRTFKAIVKELE